MCMCVCTIVCDALRQLVSTNNKLSVTVSLSAVTAGRVSLCECESVSVSV